MTDYVYIIAHEESGGAVGPVKVGVGADPQKRLKALQVGNPKPLVVAAVFGVPDREIALVLEDAFHKVMADDCILGEWFNLTPGKAAAAMRLNLSLALYARTDFTADEIQQLIKKSFWEIGMGNDRNPLE